MTSQPNYHFFSYDEKNLISTLGKEKLLETLRWMLLIRNFETMGESAYQQGKIGGFYHSYMGQEAIQTAALAAMGKDQWYATTYRCHALAMLLGVTPEEVLSELYGKATGNAKGRSGSMHLSAEHMLGGFGIVGSNIPVATGAAFSLKYKGDKEHIAVCFLGDGAMGQGSFHESLNIASLWSLPCLYIIENNHWGMGTAVKDAISVEKLAEDKAPGYNIKGYTVDGMNFFSCFAGFSAFYKEIKETGRPILVEAVTDRFRGHSIADPALYRTKDELNRVMQRDPLLIMKKALLETSIVTEEQYKSMDQEARNKILAAMQVADSAPWPDPTLVEEGVFAE